mmetsp:Transcript_140551/g.437088  ORF Transcript_140551/g.437088 Transcript_140551/m.437088 type:complete len:261 (-) Transcript_140551:162-944(-)
MPGPTRRRFCWRPSLRGRRPGPPSGRRRSARPSALAPRVWMPGTCARRRSSTWLGPSSRRSSAPQPSSWASTRPPGAHPPPRRPRRHPRRRPRLPGPSPGPGSREPSVRRLQRWELRARAPGMPGAPGRRCGGRPQASGGGVGPSFPTRSARPPAPSSSAPPPGTRRPGRRAARGAGPGRGCRRMSAWLRRNLGSAARPLGTLLSVRRRGGGGAWLASGRGAGRSWRRATGLRRRPWASPGRVPGTRATRTAPQRRRSRS